MMLSTKLFRVWQRNFLVWLTYWKPSVVGNFLDPLFMLLGLGFGLGGSVRLIEGLNYIQFLAPGIVASAAMYSATFECTFGTYTRLEPQKTFDSILMTPVLVDDIAAAEILWGAAKAIMTACAILLVMLAMPFQLVQSAGAVFVPLIGFITGLMFSAIAVLFTSYTPNYDFFSYFFTLALTPMLMLSGIFFPLDNMPKWVQMLAWFLPLTHAVNLSRSLVMGWFHLNLLWDTLWIFAFTVLIFAAAVKRLRKRLQK